MMAWPVWTGSFFVMLLLRRSVLGLAPSRPSSTRLFDANVEADFDIKIRGAKYAEMKHVSDLVAEGFYKKKDVFMHMFRLAELNRLQQNFPYADQAATHKALVAVSTQTDEIIGFVDLDNRPAKPNNHYKCNPRPVLSDLVVSPDHRRQGIAKKLIESCESACKDIFKAEELYIRVMVDNEAAKKLYAALSYEVFDNPGDPDEVVLLRKKLPEEE